MLAAPPAADPVDQQLDVLGVQVRWRGPQGCPDKDAVRDALERGDAEAAPDDARVSVEAEIRATDDRRWSMDAEVASPTGRERRSWIADDCATITRLLVVIVGSALARAHEQAPADAAPPKPPEPTPPQPARPTRDATPEPTSIAEPRTRARTGVALRISTGIESGGLPVVGPALAGGVSILRPRWRVDASALWVLPRGTQLEGGNGAGARLQLAAASLRGCARFGRDVEIPLCAGAELGAVVGTGTGVDAPQDDRVLWAAALLGTGVRVPVRRRISLVLDTQLAIPLGRPRFELRDLGTVYRARTGARALFGLEFRVR